MMEIKIFAYLLVVGAFCIVYSILEDRRKK